MNGTRILRLAVFASLLSVVVFAPQARAFQAQAQSEDAASLVSDTTGTPQEKPAAKPADKNSGKAKPGAEEPEANTNAGAEALQKATQNPVASLISVPIQNNNNFGIS